MKALGEMSFGVRAATMKLPLAFTPAGAHSPWHLRWSFRPVSGLASLDVSPSQDATHSQWLDDTPALAYRCGGSSGIASKDRKRTAFPFQRGRFALLADHGTLNEAAILAWRMAVNASAVAFTQAFQ